MPKITSEEIKQAIAETKQARDQALSQANFHAGYLKCLQDFQEREKEPEESAEKSPEKSPEASTATPGNGLSNVRHLPKPGPKQKAIEAGQ